MPSTLSSAWYDIGDRVRFNVTIHDLESEGEPLVDPDTLVFTMHEPDGSDTIYTYGVDAQLVRDNVGVFHVSWDTTQAGTHWGRYAASGNVGGAEELGIRVRRSKVLG